MYGTFDFFIQENSTCCGATKPHEPQLLKPKGPRATEMRSLHTAAGVPALVPELEKACAPHRRLNTAKSK